MSVLPLKADTRQREWHVRNVRLADTAFVFGAKASRQAPHPASSWDPDSAWSPYALTSPTSWQLTTSRSASRPHPHEIRLQDLDRKPGSLQARPIHHWPASQRI